jgi:hypothetical protein
MERQKKIFGPNMTCITFVECTSDIARGTTLSVVVKKSTNGGATTTVLRCISSKYKHAVIYNKAN